jgi:hypothetical protein
MIEIKSYTGTVLHRSEADTMRAAVEEAVAARANLAGAYLARADLTGAYLAVAYLAGANLAGANLALADLTRANLAGANLAGPNLAGANLALATLIGARPVLMIGPIGSRAAYLTSYITDAGVRVMAGCWTGTLAELAERVTSEHGDSNHGREYAAAIAMIEAHAAIWTPAAVETTEPKGASHA